MTKDEKFVSGCFDDAIVDAYMGDEHAIYYDVYEDESGHPTHEAKIEKEDGAFSIRQAGTEDWEFIQYRGGDE